MQVIAFSRLQAFWTIHSKAETPLRAWFKTAKAADWASPADVRLTYRSVDFVGDNRAIFNIGGNNYRLVCHMAYGYGRILIKFVGTHAEYDRIEPEIVS